MRSHAVFLFQRMLQVLGCTLGDSLVVLDLQGTSEETSIGQLDVPGDRGKSSNPSFRDERDHVASVPDALPRVDP